MHARTGTLKKEGKRERECKEKKKNLFIEFSSQIVSQSLKNLSVYISFLENHKLISKMCKNSNLIVRERVHLIKIRAKHLHRDVFEDEKEPINIGNRCITWQSSLVKMASIRKPLWC